MKFDLDELREAARYTDAVAEEVGLPDTCKRVGVDPDELLYLAEQRALRAVLIYVDRISPEHFQNLRPDEFKTFNPSSAARRLIPILAASYMDGMVTALSAVKTKGGSE